MMKPVIYPIFILILLIAAGCSKTSGNKDNKDLSSLRTGDIIFQTSTSSQSKAVQLATGSEYSHMGLIYRVNGELFVYEAVQPVKLTPLPKWINRGLKHHFVVKT